MARPLAREGDKPLVLIGVRVTAETRNELAEEAKAARRSISDYCRLILEDRHSSDKKAAD